MNQYEAVIEELRQQEEEIQFTSFTNDTALAIGMALLQEARKRSKPVVIDITRSGQQLFHFAMAGTTSDNGEWIKRKNNVANRFGHSSYYMGLSLQNEGQTMEEKYLIPSSDHASPVSQGGSAIKVLRTPVHAQCANAICERLLGSVRRECLDHMLILNERQLHRVLIAYVAYFNHARPHQGLGQQIPEPEAAPGPLHAKGGRVIRSPILGGLHHSYQRVA